MKAQPKISNAEWEVMKTLWKEPRLTAQEIAERLTPKTSWHPKTVKTLVNRLIKKKVVGYEKDGRAFRFLPLISESECLLTESESFLDRVFGGALQPMVAHLINQKKLSPPEIRELQAILRKGAR